MMYCRNHQNRDGTGQMANSRRIISVLEESIACGTCSSEIHIATKYSDPIARSKSPPRPHMIIHAAWNRICKSLLPMINSTQSDRRHQASYGYICPTGTELRSIQERLQRSHCCTSHRTRVQLLSPLSKNASCMAICHLN